MNMKKITPLLMLLAITVSANAQTTEHNVNVTIRPSQTVEERVADEFKARELRKAGEEKIAAEEAAKVAETNPKTLLRRARVVSVSSYTSFFDREQLQNALRKREEFDAWQMVMVEARGKSDIADITISVERPVFTYTFIYTITNRSNGIVLATGKIYAFDGNDAAPKLAKRIIEDIREARGETKKKK